MHMHCTGVFIFAQLKYNLHNKRKACEKSNISQLIQPVPREFTQVAGII